MSGNFYVHLDTRDSSAPSTPYDCSFPLNLKFQSDFRNFVSLESMKFINSVYPINSTNNTFVFRENSGVVDFTATVSAGSYTGTDMASALQTAMNASGAANTYTVTFSSTTYKITISANGVNTFNIQSSSTILAKIGFASTSTFSNSKTGSYLVRLDGTSYIDIVTSLPVTTFCSNYSRQVLKRVYFNQPFGSIIVYEDSQADALPLRTSELSLLDIQIFDDTGALWAIPQECPVQLTFRFSTGSVN